MWWYSSYSFHTKWKETAQQPGIKAQIFLRQCTQLRQRDRLMALSVTGATASQKVQQDPLTD